MKTQEIASPSTSSIAARRGEGMVVILQNNKDKTLVISNMNEALELMLGYGRGEALSRSAYDILGKKEAQLIADDLEFDDNAADFGEIFSRIREVKLRRRSGDEIKVSVTLSRLVAFGDSACFQLLIPNEQERTANARLKEFIALNLDGRKEVDAATGLPNYQTAKSFLPLLKSYFADTQSSIVFAIIHLDRFDKSVERYGADACNQLLMHAYHCCRTTFRNEDLIFALSDRALGVVLLDISRESSRVVFNRLRWKIRNHRFMFGGKADFSISTCIAFDVLNLEQAARAMEVCEEALKKLDANERNSLIELGVD
jgi:GGDEF domain-containing protein